MNRIIDTICEGYIIKEFEVLKTYIRGLLIGSFEKDNHDPIRS